jgi:hypothetical protein
VASSPDSKAVSCLAACATSGLVESHLIAPLSSNLTDNLRELADSWIFAVADTYQRR